MNDCPQTLACLSGVQRQHSLHQLHVRVLQRRRQLLLALQCLRLRLRLRCQRRSALCNRVCSLRSSTIATARVALTPIRTRTRTRIRTRIRDRDRIRRASYAKLAEAEEGVAEQRPLHRVDQHGALRLGENRLPRARARARARAHTTALRKAPLVVAVQQCGKQREVNASDARLRGRR